MIYDRRSLLNQDLERVGLFALAERGYRIQHRIYQKIFIAVLVAEILFFQVILWRVVMGESLVKTH